MADTDTANALGEAHTALLAAAKALTRIEHIAEVDAELNAITVMRTRLDSVARAVRHELLSP